LPVWRQTSTRSVAYHEHLYTKIVASGESDEIERWLDSEFESPAEPAIRKVVAGRQLTPRDWKLLIRFFAAQDVRTPARLVENLKRWSTELPELIQNTLRQSIDRFAAMTAEERAAASASVASETEAPWRITIQRNATEPGGWAKAEAISGRGMWLWSMQHVLKKTVRALYEHRWTILEPPHGMNWFTTDDPVLKLNFVSESEYTFGGGWGNVGTDLILPLSPRHLLFTQVGKPVPARGTRLEAEKASLLRRMIAEHAHRYIFSSSPDPFVEQVRPRTVNPQAVRHEATEWQRWHAEQTAAERDLLRP